MAGVRRVARWELDFPGMGEWGVGEWERRGVGEKGSGERLSGDQFFQGGAEILGQVCHRLPSVLAIGVSAIAD